MEISSSKKNSSKKFLTVFLIILTYGSLFFFGGIDCARGIVLPVVKEIFSASYSTQGNLISLMGLFHTLTLLSATLMVQRWSIKTPTVLGYAMGTIGCLVILATKNYNQAVIALIIINCGFAFLRITCNSMGIALFSKNVGFMMNLMHFFYGLGTIVFLSITGVLLNRGTFTWKSIYLLYAAPLFILLAANLLSPYKDIDEKSGASPDLKSNSKDIKVVLHSPIFWLFSISLGFASAIELAPVNWGSLYVSDVFGLDIETFGATFLSVYYTAMTLSRLLMGPIIEKLGYERSIKIGYILSFLLLLLSFLLGKSGIWLIAATGFSTGFIFPTFGALCKEYFGSKAALFFNFLTMSSFIINSAIQAFTGFLNEKIGFAWGYRFCTIYALAALVFIIIAIKTKKLTSDSAA